MFTVITQGAMAAPLQAIRLNTLVVLAGAAATVVLNAMLSGGFSNSGSSSRVDLKLGS